MKLLLADDEKDLTTVLKLHLEQKCFAVDICHDGERASYLARTNTYDAIIMDNIMPKMHGFDAALEIRSAGIASPIIMLSLKSDSKTKIDAINGGVDDYISKPFSFEELLARIRALLRRPRILEQPVYAIDNLIFDSAKHIVTRADKILNLTRKEYCLLEYLLKHKDTVVSRGMLLEHVWDSSVDPFTNTIEVHIGNIRKKVDRPGLPKLIHCIPGRGYKLSVL